MNTNDLHWLAGMLDGEGCFFAQLYLNTRSAPLTVCCEITLRADDISVLEDVMRITGLGKIYTRTRNNPKWSPQATWKVSGLVACRQLISLDIPLRSKKRRDYETWKQIVDEYGKMQRGGRGARQRNQPHLDKLQELCAQLKEERRYAP